MGSVYGVGPSHRARDRGARERMVTIAARLDEFRTWLRDPEHLAATLVSVSGAMLLAMRQGYRVPLSTGLPPSRVAAVLGLLILIAGVVSGRPYWMRLIRGVPLWPTAAALALAASIFLSAANATNGAINAPDLTLTWYATRDAVTALAAFVVIVAFIRTRESIVLVLRGLVVGGSVSALAGLIAYATGKDLAALITVPGLRYTDTQLVTNLMREGVVRPQGSAGHPLELSSVLTVLAPVAVALTFEARRRGVAWQPWALATLVLLTGAAATISRSALVGVIIAVIVFGCYWPLRRTLVVLGGCAVVLAAAWLANLALLRQLIDVVSGGSKDASLQSRSYGRGYVAEHFGDHVWLGQGSGTYDVRVQPVLDNDYLAQLMQVGIIGLGALVVFYVVGLIAGMRSAVRLRGTLDPLAEIVPGLLAAVLVVMAISMILDVGGFAQMSMLSTAMVALSVCVMRLATSAPTDDQSTSAATTAIA